MVHEYQHDADGEAWGLEASEKLGVPAERVFKTLVLSLDDRELVVGMVPVNAKLSTKLLAKAAGGKKAAMADKKKVQGTTGYVLGGVSALGQKRLLRTFIDQSAQSLETVYISAGRRGLEIELSPEALASLIHGSFAPLQQI